MGFGDREVVVRLGMTVRDYLTGAAQAEAADRRLLASQMALGASTRKVGKDLDDLGKKSNDSGAKMTKGLMPAAIALGALGAAGGGIKLLPPLLGAAGTAASALPGILGGAVDSAIVLKLGLSGVGSELGKLYKAKDPFERLTPNAVRFLQSANQVKPVLLGFQAGLQQRVTKGLGADLELFATKTLPQVQRELDAVATDWSNTFAEMALAAQDPEVIQAFNTVTGGADAFFDQINSRIRPTAKAIATLVTEAQPVADKVGKALVGMLDKFAAGVERAKRNGSLADFFEAGAESAREMLQIAGDVTRMIGQVVSEVQKQDAATGQAASSLHAYVESGRAAEDIAGIVGTLTTAYEGLAEVVGPVGALLRDALSDPGTAQSLQLVFQVLAAGSQTIAGLLRLLLPLNDALGGAPLAIIAFAFALSKMSAGIDLATAAATKGGLALDKYGASAGKVGAALPGLVRGAGGALTILLGLNVLHDMIDQWTHDAVNVDALATSLTNLAQKGQIGGELTRAFGDNLDDFGNQAAIAGGLLDKGMSGSIGRFIAGAEEAVPIAGDIAQALGAWSLTDTENNFKQLDAQLTDYVRKTGDVKGAQAALNTIMDKTGTNWADLRELLPQTNSAIGAAGIATQQLETGTKGLAERQALLNAPLQETVTLARSLVDVFNQLNGTNLNFSSSIAAAEASVDGLSAGLKKNGLALADNKKGFDLTNEKGRANFELTKQLTTAAAAAAQARIDDNGTVEQGAAVYDKYINQLRAALAAQGASPATINALVASYAQMPAALQQSADAANDLSAKLASIPKGTKFTFDGKSLVDGKGQTLDLAGNLKGLPVGKTFRWNGKDLVDGKGRAVDLQHAIQQIPGSKAAKITTPGLDPATGKVKGLAEELQGLPDGIAQIHVQNGGALAAIRQVRQSLANLGGATAAVSANRHGGIYKRAAADGLVEAKVAPPGTLYQWAEPETGGEAFVPRRGNQKRGRAIVTEAAGWYGMNVVPMAAGGIAVKQAAAGLVNVAPPAASSTTRATKLDFAESYTQARASVLALNAALKDNGRSFSVATKKGQDNRTALYGVIRAAQDAAETRFKETGSVTAANKAYDEHIARLRRLLSQQKINSATVRGLLALAQRPVYDTTAVAPKNSALLVAAARSQISAAGGIEDLRDALSLNKASVSLGSKEGRDNLSGILDFLGQAAAAAQDRYAQSGSSKLATTLYNSYITQLRSALSAAGYSPAAITSLISSYGRITLAKNARGGVHYAAGGVMSLGPRNAGVYPSSSTLYGFAEPGTGGEAFIPRNGDRRRGRELVDVAAGWYGGRFAPTGTAAGGGGTTINNNMTITPLSYNPSTTELLSYQRQMDAAARVGRRR